MPVGVEVPIPEAAALSAPVDWSMEKVDTVLPLPLPRLKLLAKRSVPAGFTASPNGLVTPTKGEPETGVSVPVVALMLKAETLFESWLATKTNLPIASTATPSGVDPVVKGEPGTAVSIPVLVLTEKADKLLAF